MATAGAVKIYVDKIVNDDISSPINLWKCRNLWKYAPEIKESNLTFRNNEIYNDSEEEQPEYGIDLDADQLTNTIIIESNKIKSLYSSLYFNYVYETTVEITGNEMTSYDDACIYAYSNYRLFLAFLLPALLAGVVILLKHKAAKAW